MGSLFGMHHTDVLIVCEGFGSNRQSFGSLVNIRFGRPTYQHLLEVVLSRASAN